MLQVKTKLQTYVLEKLLYAYDMNKNMPALMQKCKEPLIKSYSHVITMTSQSAQKDRGCTPHQPAPENRTMNQLSL